MSRALTESSDVTMRIGDRVKGRKSQRGTYGDAAVIELHCR